MQVRAIVDTIIKSPDDHECRYGIPLAAELPMERKFGLTPNDPPIEIAWHRVVGEHYLFQLRNPRNGRYNWCAYRPHVEIDTDGVNLSVPFLSQRNNAINPLSACIPTSWAMVLKFYNVSQKTPRLFLQFEDELIAGVRSYGDRFAHDNWVRFIRNRYGVKSRFSTTATWEEIKKHLDNGNPVIMSGSFTRSGHILVIRGYDEKGYFVNDPYGEVIGRTFGYRNISGENLHYSAELMAWAGAAQAGAGRTWAYFPERP